MLKNLQARLQQYVHRELPDVQSGFRKGKGTRDQIPNTCWIIEKAREFQKNISFCFIDYAKAFDCMDHNKLWKILKEMGIPDHLTCLLRNLYAGQEATVINCLFNCYAEYIMRNAGLEETQAGIKITGRKSITSDMQMTVPLWQKVKRNLKSLLKKVKGEREEVGLKLNIQKTEIMASGPITSWEIDGETVATVSDFIFFSPKSLQTVIAAMKLTDTYSLEEKAKTLLCQLRSV